MKRINLAKYKVAEAFKVLHESCEDRNSCESCIFNKKIDAESRCCVLEDFENRFEGLFEGRLILTLDAAKTEKEEAKNA
jgi:hypothetical protein